MDENNQIQVNENIDQNINQQAQQNVQVQQQNMKDFLRDKEFEYATGKSHHQNMSVKLAGIKVKEKLGDKTIKAKYTKKVKGEGYQQDKADTREYKNDNDNRLLSTESYRLQKFYSEEANMMETEYTKVDTLCGNELMGYIQELIEEKKAEYDLKIASVADGTFRQKERERIAKAYTNLTDAEMELQYEYEVGKYSDKQLEDRLKKDKEEAVNFIKSRNQIEKEHKTNRRDIAKAWMTKDDTEGNKKIYRAIWGKTEERNRFLDKCADEILSYDFSLNMLNLNWLSENGDVVCRMLKRVYAFSDIYRLEHNYKPAPDIQQALDDKYEQVDNFKRMLDFKCKEWGVEFNESNNLLLQRNVGKADKDALDKADFDGYKADFEKYKNKEKLYFEKKALDVGQKKEYSERALKLRYADFLLVLGEKNRGQVVLDKKGRLSIINNGYTKRNKTGEESAENLRVKERFFELALDQLGEKEKGYYRPLFEHILGLDRGEETSKPLSRKAILEIVSELRSRDSLVKKTKADTGNAALAAFASKLDTFFGQEPLAEDVKNVKSRKTRDIRNRFKTIIRNQAGGARVKLPSDRLLNRLIKENMDLLKDEILKAAMACDTIMKNTGNHPDNAFLTGANQDQLIEKLAAHVVKKLCSEKPSDDDEAEYSLDKLVLDTALDASGKPELKTKLANAYSATFASGSILGLYELVEDRKFDNLKLVSSTAFKKDLDAFALLIESMNSIADYNNQLLTRNTSDIGLDKKEVLDKARIVKGLMTEEPDRFAKVLEILKGSRFVTGFNELKAKIDGGLDFVKNEEDILNGLSTRRVIRPVQRQEAEIAVFKGLTKAQEENLASLKEDDKALVNILLLKTLPSDMIKDNEDDFAKSIIALRKNISKIPEGQAFVTQVTLGKSKMRLSRREDKSMTMCFGDKEIPLNVPLNRIVEYIDADMCSSVDKYGKKTVYAACFANLDSEAKMSFGEIAKNRDISIKVICAISGKPAAFYENISTDKLITVACEMLMGMEKKDAALRFAKMSGYSNINEKETLELLEMLNKEEEEQLNQEVQALVPAQKVIIKKQQAKQVPQDEPQWSKEELMVKELITDMIYGSTRVLDKDISEKTGNKLEVTMEKTQKEKSGEYIDDAHLEASLTSGHLLRDSLFRHADAISLILSTENMDIIDRTIKRMSVPDPAPGQYDFKTKLIEGIKDGLRLIDDELKLTGKSEQEVKDALKRAKEGGVEKKKYEAPDQKIKDAVKKCCEYMQKEIEKAANHIFEYKEQGADNDNLPALDKTLPKAELDERKAQHDAELKKRIKKEALNSTGQGALNKKILCEYFKSMKIEDQMSMVASIFKNSVPKKELANNATEAEKKAEETRMRGNTLAGYLKGAGPLMQKLLQGMPEQAMPEDMQLAVKDMKSKLTPIPEDVVRVRMRSIVERSKGNITKIEVTRSLGAASVGQAFLCKLYGPQLPETGKNVVIKLLRPDARNRMAREKDFLDTCAKQVDNTGSMGKTLSGQLERIMEELDLTAEARNIKRGVIYNEGDPCVKSVGVSELVEPTTNTLVLEMAEGTTVDKYLEETKTEEYDIMSRFCESNGEGLVIDPVTKKPKLLAAKKNGASITGSRKELEAILTRLEKRQNYLSITAKKWVSEGIYGEGFYHGDLHSGNIMISDNGVTLIDFGNATKLDDKQKKYITRLTAAAAVGETDDFVDAFFKLIGEDAKTKYRNKLDEFTREIKSVFKVGNKENAGQRISLIILKAQTLKIEVPAAINNFSQSQMRIQNTVEDINKRILSVRKNIELLDTINEESKVDVLLACQREALNRNEKIETVAAEYVKKLNIAPINKVMEDVRLVSAPDREQFNERYINIFTQETPAVTEMKNALTGLRNIQDHPENEQLEDDLAVKEAQFMNAYSKACQEAALKSELATGIRNQLRSNDEAVISAVEEEFKPYFTNAANSGSELEAAYKALKTAQREHAAEDVQKEKEDAFLKLYFSVASSSLNSMIRQKKNAEKKPKTFFKAMTEVLLKNVKASLKMFGTWRGYQYKKKLA